jgi:hypothetical protein
MNNPACSGGGASLLACVFALGSGTNPPYCATPPQVPPGPAPNGGLNYPNGGWFACSIVTSKTGATIGSAGGGTSYGTGVKGGISYICNNYKDPYQVQQGNPPGYTGNTWVITLPLINPTAFINNNGSSSQMDIVAFANFEIDCGAFGQGNGWTLSGSSKSIVGRFVRWAGAVATTGNPNGVDTGVEVVILVQ